MFNKNNILKKEKRYLKKSNYKKCNFINLYKKKLEDQNDSLDFFIYLFFIYPIGQKCSKQKLNIQN